MGDTLSSFPFFHENVLNRSASDARGLSDICSLYYKSQYYLILQSYHHNFYARTGGVHLHVVIVTLALVCQLKSVFSKASFVFTTFYYEIVNAMTLALLI